LKEAACFEKSTKQTELLKKVENKPIKSSGDFNEIHHVVDGGDLLQRIPWQRGQHMKTFARCI